MGSIRFLQTTEFEPAPTGTIIHMRMAAPGTRKERVVLKLGARMLAKGLREANARLVEQLDAELERRGRDATNEPDLPRPRPDSVLTGLASESA
jgi:hypothetical protein